ncbi:MAG TPA: NAD(P)(+) transhydrogenase (Re/Si-specific) subunit beta, partial [Alphaproteobacteria bacterium]|nr:NAD(P)(+) transhydrogenase (Re/Si-specific) subunit beta [Alphaproteobacteria bacterium]
MSANLSALAYLVSSILFIMALRGLSSPESSRRGNMLGMIGMAIAVGTTIAMPGIFSFAEILAALVIGGGVGAITARRVQMTQMPQLVAAFHSLVGMAAVLVAAAAFYNPAAYGISDAAGLLKLPSRIEMSLGIVIGAITFSGSVIAFLKLAGLVSGNPVTFKGQHLLNLLLGLVILGLIVAFVIHPDPRWFWAMTALAFLVGFLIIIPIGGADMPVVVSMLNSYSGWAAAGIGFTLQNPALIVTGALVGSSGAILSYIMCHAMNRSFISVILGGFGGETGGAAAAGTGEVKPVKLGSADDAAFIMKNAGKVIIVPGYGMAVSQAQHALREMGDKLKEEGVEVK